MNNNQALSKTHSTETELHLLRDSTQVAEVIRNRYGTFEHGFLTKFNSDNTDYPTIYAACRADTPSMIQVDNAYGSNSALTWLVARLTEVAAFTGIRENLNETQTIRCAQKMRAIGYHITVAEMMAFFELFENGHYSSFVGYSRPNPQTILKSFSAFVSDLFIERQVADGERQSAINDEERATARRNRCECPKELAEKNHKAYLAHRHMLPERDRKRDVSVPNYKKQQ